MSRVLVALFFAGLLTASHAQTINRVLFGLTNSWKYNQTASYDGSNWTARAFDDSLLPSGRGVLAWERQPQRRRSSLWP